MLFHPGKCIGTKCHTFPALLPYHSCRLLHQCASYPLSAQGYIGKCMIDIHDLLVHKGECKLCRQLSLFLYKYTVILSAYLHNSLLPMPYARRLQLHCTINHFCITEIKYHFKLPFYTRVLIQEADFIKQSFIRCYQL